MGEVARTHTVGKYETESIFCMYVMTMITLDKELGMGTRPWRKSVGNVIRSITGSFYAFHWFGS